MHTAGAEHGRFAARSSANLGRSRACGSGVLLLPAGVLTAELLVGLAILLLCNLQQNKAVGPS